MSIHNLPCEMLRSVFQNADSHDIPRLRTVCKMFNNVIKSNYCFLPRVAYLVKIFSENGQIMIANMKSGDIKGCTQKLSEFDFTHWREIGIVELEFEDIKNCDQQDVKKAFRTIIQEMIKTRQTQLRKMIFTNVDVSNKVTEEIEALFGLSMKQCENVTVENSVLPISFNQDSFDSSKFDHFRWVSSDAATPLPCNQILKKLQNDMKIAVNKRSFLAEMDSVGVDSVCDFLEEWLRLPIASFFNLSFHNCDDTWKTRFLAECERRELTHNYMEFQSRTHNNAHVKVSFSQDASTCCIWPVLDVPATGQSVCYARYFRDF
uniref:F-box domain-containing protein n=1 Tax=Caenorhabditis tropicalis TaxID=1561998 RepID=A0A1I7SZG3_9PELO